ncbi:MAG: TylF/MycF/NovP-related O-methyltransferase [Pseudomonadota bacterium]
MAEKDASALAYFADSPFLLCSRQALTSSLFRFQLYEQIVGVQGSIIECGVHRGNNFMLFNQLASILEPYNLNRRIIGFDTFEGFPDLDAERDGNGIPDGMFSDTSYNDLRRLLAIHEKNRAVPHVPRGELVRGDACETIPQYVADNPHLVVAMLYIDFDIYEPTRVALEHLVPLMPKGAIVAFDEVNVGHWPGEAQAMREYFDMNALELRRSPFEPYASYAVIGGGEQRASKT